MDHNSNIDTAGKQVHWINSYGVKYSPITTIRKFLLFSVFFRMFTNIFNNI